MVGLEQFKQPTNVFEQGSHIATPTSTKPSAQLQLLLALTAAILFFNVLQDPEQPVAESPTVQVIQE
jgi:hypothetical protein